jgi:hypothetical protein
MTGCENLCKFSLNSFIMDADSPGAVPGKYEFRIRRKNYVVRQYG